MNVFQMKTRPHRVERFREFIDENFVCIGWPGIGDLSHASTDEIRTKLEQTYGYAGHKLGNALGQVNTFVNTMKTGDVVIIAENGYASIGVVGDYTYESQYDNIQDGMCHRRGVEWKGRLPITDFDSGIQRLISNRNTICQYPESIEKSGLDKLLGVKSSLNKENSAKLESLFNDALKVLEEELKSSDPDRRLKAATELIKLKNN